MFDWQNLWDSPQDNFSLTHLLADPSNSNASIGAPGQQHFQAAQNQLPQESGSFQPEIQTNGLLFEPQNIHVQHHSPEDLASSHEQQHFPVNQSELVHSNSNVSQPSMTPQNIQENASSGVLVEEHFQAGQSNLVQKSGLSQASHQHKGRGKDQKRRRKTQGEEQVIMSKSLSVKEALVEIKNLGHQVDRRRDKLGYLKPLHSFIYRDMKIKIEREDKNKNDDFLNLWAKRPDVQKLDKIELELKEIKDKCHEFNQKQGSMEGIPNELSQRLGEIRIELEPNMAKLNEESKEVDELASLLVSGDIDTETLRERLRSLCPWWFNKDEACPNHDDDDEPVEDFVKKLDSCERTVDPSDFEGLQEELKTCPGWEIPESLKPIADKIGDVCPKTITFPDKPDLIMLCAAVKEMDKVQRLEQVSKCSLLKWGAAINRANKIGIHLKSAKMHLKRIAYAYFGPKADEKIKINEKKRLKLDAEDKVLKECVDAAKEFQGNVCLSDGLFA